MSVSASDIQAAQQNARAPDDILFLTQQGFWRRHRLQIAIAGVALAMAAGLAWLMLAGDNSPPPRQVRELQIINVTPPPPPPPPPPQQQPPPQQKMIEQPKMVTPEVKPPDKPDDKPLDKPKAADKDDAPPPGPLALDAKADGPGDVFGLGGKPGGRGLLGGGDGGGGSRWGWYATQVQNAIEDAIHANPKTRVAVMQIEVRLWADQGGHITRVQLAGTTGDPEIDAALRNDVLPALTLSQPPPQDMPMPIVARITARRPN